MTQYAGRGDADLDTAEPESRLPGATYLPMQVRFACLLIAYGGRVPAKRLRELAYRLGITEVREQFKLGRSGSNGSHAGYVVYRRMKELRRAGLVERDGDDFVATDLVGLAGMVADEVERHADRTDQLPGPDEG